MFRHVFTGSFNGDILVLIEIDPSVAPAEQLLLQILVLWSRFAPIHLVTSERVPTSLSLVPFLRQPVVMVTTIALVTRVVTTAEVLIVIAKSCPTFGNISLVLTIVVGPTIPVAPVIVVIPVVVPAVVVVVVTATSVIRVEVPISVIVPWWSTVSTHLLWGHSPHTAAVAVVIVPETPVAILHGSTPVTTHLVSRT